MTPIFSRFSAMYHTEFRVFALDIGNKDPGITVGILYESKQKLDNRFAAVLIYDNNESK